MAEGNEKKADIIRDAVKDAREILNAPMDLADLSIPKEKAFLDEYGRFDENWAGKLFDKSVYPHSETIDGWPFEDKADLPFVFRSKEELRPTPEHRLVPLVMYRDGIVDDEHREKIGTAKVYPDGSFTAELDEGNILEDTAGLVGPFSGRAFSFGQPIDIDKVDEVNVDGGGRPTPPKSYWIADFKNIKER